MKKEDVPQDPSSLSALNAKELYYALDKDGNYTTAKSSGWEAKTIALDNAMEEIKARVKQAKNRVLQGEQSPLVYYMELHKMDLGILASYVSMPRWRVKRHFSPKRFNKLSDKILNKYAKVFQISVDQLKTIPDED